MFHHSRGRQLDRIANRQALRGNFGAAVALHAAADVQHAVGVSKQIGRLGVPGFRRVAWSPWYTSHWLVRRSFRREIIRRSMIVQVTPGIPIHETVIVMNPSSQLIVLPADSYHPQCSNHVLVDLPEIIQVTFDQEGQRTVLYADRKCTNCGQHFFCYPDSSPPPYSFSSTQSQPPYPQQPQYTQQPQYPQQQQQQPPYPQQSQYPQQPQQPQQSQYPQQPQYQQYPQQPQQPQYQQYPQQPQYQQYPQQPQYQQYPQQPQYQQYPQQPQYQQYPQQSQQAQYPQYSANGSQNPPPPYQ